MTCPRTHARPVRRALGAVALVGLATAAAAAPLALVTPVRLTNGNNSYGDSNPAWTPDGARVAYDSRDGDPYYPAIYYKQISGGTETQLTGQGEPTPDYEHPAYSPDGSQIAYAKKDGSWYHIFRRPAGGGVETPVTSGAAGPATGLYGDFYPAWSPDGQWIAFGSSRGDLQFGFYDIWVVRSDGTGLKQATTQKAPDTGWPSWAPDGNTLIYSQNDQIWRVSRGGGSSWAPPVWLWDGGSHPSFAPDGRRVAYDFAGDILVRAYPGGAPVAVTSGADEDLGPSWSPDGKSLAFSSNRGDGNRAIWVASGLESVPTVPATLARVKALYR
jgi:Tol biopolymer transport system component